MASKKRDQVMGNLIFKPILQKMQAPIGSAYDNVWKRYG